MNSSFRNGADFNHNSVKKVKSEAMTSAEISTRLAELTTSETGEFIYNQSQMRVFNGNKFVSYVNSEFALSQLTITWVQANVFNDDYIRTDINSGEFNQLIELLYNDSKSYWPLGNIHYITMTGADYAQQHGRIICLSALNGCWFNIINNTSNTLEDPQRKIITGTGGNLNYISKALLIFRDSEDAWEVLSYERMPFHRRFTISASANDSNMNKTGTIPSDGGLPYKGYYMVELFINVTENGPAPLNGMTNTSQTLTINGDTVDVSGYMVSDGTTGIRWFNKSLHGFNRVNVNQTTPASRVINYGTYLPNGNLHQITGGYAEITYLGENENEYMLTTR